MFMRWRFKQIMKTCWYHYQRQSFYLVLWHYLLILKILRIILVKGPLRWRFWPWGSRLWFRNYFESRLWCTYTHWNKRPTGEKQDGNRQMAEKKSWKKFILLSKQQAETLYLFYSLKRQVKNIKRCICTESNDLIEAF